jgi:hypothetical protein
MEYFAILPVLTASLSLSNGCVPKFMAHSFARGRCEHSGVFAGEIRRKPGVAVLLGRA